MTETDLKMIELFELAEKIHDPLVMKFMDFESEWNVDEKITVLKSLISGKTPAEIPLYYDVLEKMPKDQPWDL